MKPIGPLMWEHRLIEKMARLFKVEIEKNTEKKRQYRFYRRSG